MKQLRLAVAIMMLAIPLYAQAGAGFTKIGNATTTTFTDPSCPNLSTCFYQVTSVDSTGHESLPASCSSTALCLGGNQVIAQMPSSGTHVVTLSWTASTTAGVSYNIYQHIGPFPPTNATSTVN